MAVLKRLQINAFGPVFSVVGANTDVGKTLVSAGLLAARVSAVKRSNHALEVHGHTGYIKPLQTGTEWDTHKVQEAIVHAGAKKQHTIAASKADLAPHDSRAKLAQYQVQSTHHQIRHDISTQCSFWWPRPESPHLASQDDSSRPSTAMVLDSIKKFISDLQVQDKNAFVLVEGAGGVNSPSVNLNTEFPVLQSDLFRPLRLKTILVADPKLGGISSTISAYESLILRGHHVCAIVGIGSCSVTLDFVDRYLREVHNRSPLYFNCNDNSSTHANDAIKQSDTIVFQLPEIKNEQMHVDWIDAQAASIDKLYTLLCQYTETEHERIHQMVAKGKELLWWPFTQYVNLQAPLPNREKDVSKGAKPNSSEVSLSYIDSAFGNEFVMSTTANFQQHIENGIQVHLNESRCTVDGSASWWTNGMGHADSGLSLAMAAANGRYGHVLFPNNFLEPSILLAEKLMGRFGPGAGWASRVFFTDNGSTAVEVALKMGFKWQKMRHHQQKQHANDTLPSSSLSDSNMNSHPNELVITTSGCYHGDTLGTMNCAEDNVFTKGQHPWFQSASFPLFPPVVSQFDALYTVSMPPSLQSKQLDQKDLQVPIDALFDLEKRKQSVLADLYKDHVEHELDLAVQRARGPQNLVFMIEPILMGAAGMVFVDPLFQRLAIEACKHRKVCVVYDEVFVGMYRLGVSSTRELLGISPDISVYAKTLTGGTVPLSVTLASQDVFEAYKGPTKADALLHGHSYTAHPIGCAAANHAFDAYSKYFDSTPPAPPAVELSGKNVDTQTKNLLFSKIYPKRALKEVLNSNDKLKSTSPTTITTVTTITKTVPETEMGISPLIQPNGLWDAELCKVISMHPQVDRFLALGSVLAFELSTKHLNASPRGYESPLGAELARHLRSQDVAVRPLGNVVYLMVHPMTDRAYAQDLQKKILLALTTYHFELTAPSMP